MKKGLFITLEGPEGSGKSTQAPRLREYLKKAGYDVVHTREPGGTRVAESVRKALLDPGAKVSAWAELFLYEAARAQHVAEIIRPALRQGRVVLCERFTDATEAYQGWGRGLPLRRVKKLNQWAAQGVRPDLTFLLDAPVDEGLARARGRAGKNSARKGDRLERESSAFHRRVRRGYLAMARREPERFRVIPWREGAEKVHASLIEGLRDFLVRRRLSPARMKAPR